MKFTRPILTLILTLLLFGCTTTPTITPVSSPSQSNLSSTLPPTDTAAPTQTPRRATLTSTSTASAQPSKTQPAASSTASPVPTSTPTSRPTLAAGEWKELPVVPRQVSSAVVEIYQHGVEAGNNPRAFSKIGDCGSTPAWFLGDFDRGPQFYRLGEYQYLEPVIQEFEGSYDRTSLAARSGFNAPSLFVPLWADRTYCQANETPLACEYRIHKPVIAFIMLGANDVWHAKEFEPQMRKIIEFSIANGTIPILSTKADNQEGNDSINETIASLAHEYDIPLWNYWLAVQDLPEQGLQEDKVHLTFGRNFFDDTEAMSKAWPVRNLTALQILDAVWRTMTEQSQ